MFKHIISELKEALVCLQAGQVTLAYPFQPHAPGGEFRGKPVLDVDKCIGCGACANACPARLITLDDVNGYRTLHFELGRCTYCANCRDVCPQQALRMSPQFELSTSSLEDLLIHVQFKLVLCRSCGEAVGTQRSVNLVNDKLAASELHQDDRDYLDLCIACKRKLAIHTPSLNLEVVP